MIFKSQARLQLKHYLETDLGMVAGQVLASGAVLVLPYMDTEFLTSINIQAKLAVAAGGAQLIIAPRLRLPDGVTTFDGAGFINQVMPATGAGNLGIYCDQRLEFARYVYYGGTGVSGSRNTNWPNAGFSLVLTNNGPAAITFTNFQLSLSGATY